MLTFLTGTQMKSCDRHAIEVRGIPSRVLMQRAAEAAVGVLETEGFDLRHILIAVGSGNNGGDGLAMARILSENGYRVSVLFAGTLSPDGTPDKAHMSGDFLEQYANLPESIPVLTELSAQIPNPLSKSKGIPTNVTAIVDAIFGIGMSRDISGRTAELIDRINDSGIPVLAVDIPSGIHADTGSVMGHAIRAKATVAIDQYKAGHLLYPGREYCGKLLCRSIGIGTSSLSSVQTGSVLEANDLPVLLPPRPARSNKGTFGRVLIVAGSYAMAGAAYLSAKAAYRTGAGLVEILTPEENRIILQTLIPEAVLTCYRADSPDPEQIRSAVGRADAAVVGPGLGRGDGSLFVLKTVAEALTVPTVADADALNLMASHPELLRQFRCPLILTPHPAEFSRLSQLPIASVLSDLPGNAAEYAKATGAVCVLKDATTVIASPDGKRFLNTSGNSGMATGGSGDVLTGIIAALLSAGRNKKVLSPVLAAALGVYLHGLAGDAASERLGEASVMAGDIADGIAEVLKALPPTQGIERKLSQSE